PPAQASQYPGIAPLVPAAVRPERATDNAPIRSKSLQDDDAYCDAETEVLGGLAGRERRVRARVTSHQVAERVDDRFGECFWNADRQWHAKRVAQPPSVLDRGPALLYGNTNSNDPA